MPSRRDRVYFSKDPELAYLAAPQLKGPGFVFEVTLPDDLVASGNLGPDEDTIAMQIGFREGWWKPGLQSAEIDEKLREIIATVDVTSYAAKWAEYLVNTRTTSLRGRVLPNAISRYASIAVGNIPEVLAMWKHFNEGRVWSWDDKGKMLPEHKAMKDRVYDSLRRSLMDGAPFDAFDDLYPTNWPERDTSIGKFQKQLCRGVRQFTVEPKSDVEK